MSGCFLQRGIERVKREMVTIGDDDGVDGDTSERGEQARRVSLLNGEAVSW